MLSASKRVVFGLVLCTFIVSSIEGLARFTYLLFFGFDFSHHELNRFTPHLSLGQEGLSGGRLSQERQVLHPYLGYVPAGLPGSLDDESALISTACDRLVVAVLGGSVAAQLVPSLRASFAKEVIESDLPLTPVIVNLAMPGYKQPQQLLAMTYFLSLGSTYDVVINLDGFNELVVFMWNDGKRIYPFYPSQWKQRILSRREVRAALLRGQAAHLRRQQLEYLEEAKRSPWVHSAVYGWLASYRLRGFERSMTAIKDARGSVLKGRDPEAAGPLRCYGEEEEAYTEAAEVWARSSLLLEDLSKTMGFDYYHFLQPNQYVEGSKNLTREERRSAYLPGSDYAEYAAKGYPFLMQEAAKLTSAGVNFVDLTRMFLEVEKSVYSDTCCHLNSRGRKLVSESILEHILDTTKVRKLSGAEPCE